MKHLQAVPQCWVVKSSIILSDASDKKKPSNNQVKKDIWHTNHGHNPKYKYMKTHHKQTHENI